LSKVSLTILYAKGLDATLLDKRELLLVILHKLTLLTLQMFVQYLDKV
jgi:hypothetical protein